MSDTINNKIVSVGKLKRYHAGIKPMIDEKVAKETGKGLSTNDFTNELKSKLENIESGAQKNVDVTSEGIITALGYTPAQVDSDGKIPVSQLPSYVSDVFEYDNKESFPSTGTPNKIYVAKDTNLTYRWSGTVYVEISQSLAIGETASTAFPGDKGKQAFEHISNTSNPHGVTAEQLGLGNVENKSSETIRGELTSSNVTGALGYTPVNSSEFVFATDDDIDSIFDEE